MSELLKTVRTADNSNFVMLYDSEYEGKVLPEYFDPDYWHARPQTEVLAHGRVVTLKVQSEYSDKSWVLRQYYRGGLFGRFVKQSYVFTKQDNVRSFAEWRMTNALYKQGLPVAKPIAALYFRTGLIYKAAILIEFIPDTKTLSQLLQNTGPINWSEIAQAIYSLHRAGLVHSDLNAHNILIDKNQKVTVIDLDKSGYYPGMMLTAGHRESLSRLHRSINKVSQRKQDEQHNDWGDFINAYRDISDMKIF